MNIPVQLELKLKLKNIGASLVSKVALGHIKSAGAACEYAMARTKETLLSLPVKPTKENFELALRYVSQHGWSQATMFLELDSVGEKIA